MPRPRTVGDADVLAATARVIGRVGVGALTLADVGREAGLSPATLVQRFGSKRGLLLALAAGAPASLPDTFAAARRGRRSPLAALRAALLALAGGLRDPDELANHLGFLALDIADPEFRAHSVAWFDTARDEIAQLLDEAVERGELEPVDTRALARSVLVAYNGAALTWGVWRDGPLERRLERELEVVLSAARRPAA